jgi:predicted lipoprotein with Yx(FWY)xxD motif
MGSMRGSSLPRRTLLSRSAGAALLAATGGIHLDLYLTGYRTIPTIGWLFLLQVITAFVLAIAVAANVPLAAPSGALFAIATLGGYLLSLWVGLFGFREVRSTAGIVAGVIEVATFAVLVPLVPKVPWRAIAGASVVALVLLAVGFGTARGGGATTAGTLRTAEIGGVKVLTNAKGITLYSFAPDTATASRCYGSCASYWPPVLGKPAAGPGVTGTIGTITRSGGAIQATYDGHPLYTYIGDSGPGQDNGNKIDLNGGFWYDVTP